MNLPEFPFIGAGEAQYFEWAEMFIRFVRTPSESEKKAIEKDIPPPLQDTVEWNGALLFIASSQGVGRFIRATYATKKKKGTAPELTTRNRFSQASPVENKRFNAHIEAWLLEAHQCVSILVAFRREDGEAGGTELSIWHHESIKQVPYVLAKLGQEKPSTEETRLALRLANWAALEHIKIPEKILEPFQKPKEKTTKPDQ